MEGLLSTGPTPSSLMRKKSLDLSHPCLEPNGMIPHCVNHLVGRQAFSRIYRAVSDSCQ